MSLLIVANGVPATALLKRAAREADAVICTDGAYAKAAAVGVRPEVIVGDLDSHRPGTRLHKGVRILLDDDPELSDLEKALRFAAESRFAARFRHKGPVGPEVWVAAATGGRLDQTFSNLQVVEKYAPLLPLRVLDAGGAAQVVAGRAAFRSRRGETVSLFPIGTATVTTRGLKYPLKRERLVPGSRGLSNIALGASFSLTVQGSVWLVREKLPWD